MVLAQGLVGGAGLQGAWSDGADVLPLAQRDAVASGRPDQTAGAVEGETVRPGRGRRPAWQSPIGSLGEAAEGDSSRPDVSGGGLSRRPRG